MADLGLPPPDIEKSIISSVLNSVILLVFLTGMYTVIYGGTMYIYLTRNTSKRYLVPTTVTILFLSTLVGTAVQWYATKWQFVDEGDNLDSVFLAGFGGPQWMNLANNITLYIVLMLADGLLIWRCFFVWDRSFRVISVSLFLLIAETAFFVVQIVIRVNASAIVSPAKAQVYNDLISVAFFTSFGTTFITTLLIAYRIHSAAKEGVSVRRFRHVLDIVVQSGAVYALSLLAIAVSGVIPQAASLGPVNLALDDYVQTISFSIPGMAATVMVTRVAMLSSETTFPSNATRVTVSGLQFNARETYEVDHQEGTEATRSVDGDELSVGEAEKAAGKVQ